MTARRISLVSLVLGAMVLATAWLHASMRAPAELDLSRTRLGARGVYRATITPEPDTIRVGRMHAWTLHLETPDGRPADAATITVTGGMPQHGHGLPTKPRVTRALGSGNHRVEGMKFNMRGWWTVTFAIDAAAGADSVTFNLDL